MFAQEIFGQALQRLADVERVRVACRTTYASRGQDAPWWVTRRFVRYIAPDRIQWTFSGGDAVGDPVRDEYVQVGEEAHETRESSSEAWRRRREPSPMDRASLIQLFSYGIPSPDVPGTGGMGIVSYGFPHTASVRLGAEKRWAVALPVENQIRPYVILPATPPTRGGGRPRTVFHEGQTWFATRLVEQGELCVEGRSGLPIRYVQRGIATIEDGREVVTKRTHVRFRYEGVGEIRLPEE